MEIWKDIEGFEGRYQVSNLGRVKSLNYHHEHRIAILKNRLNRSGYYEVVLCKNNTMKSFKVHRLVAIAFIPNPHNLPCVNHKDENKLNNFVWVNDDGTIDLEKSNLEWCTHKYNTNYGTCQERKAAKMINNTSRSKAVAQYTLDWQLVGKYPSQCEAARQTGIPHKLISQNCCGESKTCHGFIFKFI